MTSVPGSAVFVAATLAVATWAVSGARVETERPPLLTRDVPGAVERACASARASSPLPVVCPPLVPVTRYRSFPGVHGVVLGNSIPLEPPRDRIYLLGFNAGDTGPQFWHWIAGMGSPEAIAYWVLSDARNVVRGKPKRVEVGAVEGRRIELWRFPDHPAGGQFGGHDAAIAAAGPLRAIASIHGDTEGSVKMAVALAAKAERLLAARTSLRRFERSGIAFAYPASWFVTAEPLSNGVDPKYVFTLSTRPVRRTPRDVGPCLPGIARQLGDVDVLVYLREAVSGRKTSLARMQARPRSFRLPTRADTSLCGFPHGRWIPFASGGRAFYLGLHVGQRASPARVRALRRVVDGMRIDAR